MNKVERDKIADKLHSLETSLKFEYGLHRLSGGFVIIDMDEYDDDFIYVTIKDGIQSDCCDSVNTTHTTLYRDTLEWKE
jgi:hypothetical protein